MAEFYTIGEAARLLGVRREIVRIRINQGRIKAEHTWGKEGGHYRIPKENIDAIVAQRKGENTEGMKTQTVAKEIPAAETPPAAPAAPPAPQHKAKTVIINRSRKKAASPAVKKVEGVKKETQAKEKPAAPAVKQPAGGKHGETPAPQPKRRFGEDYGGFI